MKIGQCLAGGMFLLAGLTGTAPGFTASPTRAAEYQLCNQTSYVLDAALAVQIRQTTASQGWFRIYPGDCEVILSRTEDSERYFVYARTPDAYDTAPLPTAAANMICVAEEDFLIPGAWRCADPNNSMVSFSEVTADTNSLIGQTILTGENNFDQEQARIAGLQRLLIKAGFDPGVIDGNQGEQTSQALAAFRQRNNVSERESDAILFQALLDAAIEKVRSVGLTYCNDTEWTVFAAVGISSENATRAEGWFELAPGGCTRAIRDALEGDKLHVFAQAHDGNGFPVIHNGAPLQWGGDTELCTKATRFETETHENCRAQGLNMNGFTSEDIGERTGRIIRFGIADE